MARSVDPTREAAFDALQDVTIDGAYANLALRERLAAAGLEGRDAGFATELVYGTCRALGTYDRIIEVAAKRDLASLESGIIDVLRLVAHQLFAMRVPLHAAVDANVDVAARVVGHRATGVINAVARKLGARSYAEWIAELSDGLSEYEALALRTAHPRWIVDAYADVLPAEELEAALMANNEAPETTLVVRPGLLEVSELPGEPLRYSPYGTSFKGNPGAIAAVRNGKAGVQDEGSQLVAMALAAASAPAGPWLDLCAGPGGKSALLAGFALARHERLIAVEPHAQRAQLVKKALRAYPGFPWVIVGDGLEPAWQSSSFARVLADVPCSGLGALRRRPEARWRKEASDIAELAQIQQGLLTTALDSVAPGGVVAYVTCSPHRAETRDVVEAAIVNRAVTVLDAPHYLPEVSDAALGRYLQLWPHRHGTDAMFCALLQVDKA
ncbi:MAG: RsmB/NOP family class I SAM-dependent RNA methyltransferase [Propionibacteriaceae bacterium]